mgnify:CR=1 FL=1
MAATKGRRRLNSIGKGGNMNNKMKLKWWILVALCLPVNIFAADAQP